MGAAKVAVASAAALLVRLGLVAYGSWQDTNMVVKYTDIDYEVVHDGARFIFEGGSPYERATYRYTPLLAAMLLPNLWLESKVFGKILFVVFDLLIGLMLYLIASIQQKTSKKPSSSWPLVCAAFWLFNPIAVNVSTRGNSEAIVGSLVLVALYFLMRQQEIISALFFGLAIHFKIYPIIFSVAIFFFIDREKPFRRGNFLLGIAEQFSRPRRIRYALITVATIGFLTWVLYKIYGWTFLYETYLYHVIRKDHRHNFSIYFYQMYLSSSAHDVVTPSASTAIFSVVLDVLEHVGAFLPQLLSLAVLTFKFCRRDLPFALFGMTVAFVAFNKVCTVQYFIWYFSLLPLIVSRLNVSLKEYGLVFAFWMGTQGLWLGLAFLLEFHGRNTFLWIWLASIGFFASHIGSLCFFVNRHAELH